MPTGYTADIANGITFEQYAWRCARAFGALVELRDDPDAPIPEKFEPSSYYAEPLAKREAWLAQLLAMTDEDAQVRADVAFREAVAAREERIRQRADLQQKYEAMLLQVQEWAPPTPEHLEYKAFMLEQISKSIAFDCGDSFDKAPERTTGGAWLQKEIADARRSLAYAQKGLHEERERAEKRTAWVQALRDSIGQPQPA